MFMTTLNIKFLTRKGDLSIIATRTLSLRFPPYPGLRITVPYFDRRVVYDIIRVEYDVWGDAFKCTTSDHEIKIAERDGIVSALKEDGWWILDG